jgi:hypothetical protein
VRADLDTGGITLPDAVELAKLAKMPERLESARKRGAMYGTISAAVARELQEHEREVAGRKLRKQLLAEGVTLVEWPQQGGWWNQEAKPLHHLPWVDAEAHATEPCHAGSVSPQAEVVWLCTAPDNHPQPEPQPGEGYQGGAGYGFAATVDDPAERARLEEQRQRAQEHREALDKAREARSVHMRDLLGRRLPKPDLAEHLALSFVLNGQGIERDDYSQACNLLGVDDEEAPNPIEALMAHAVEGGVEAAARVGLAVNHHDKWRGSHHGSWRGRGCPMKGTSAGGKRPTERGGLLGDSAGGGYLSRVLTSGCPRWSPSPLPASPEGGEASRSTNYSDDAEHNTVREEALDMAPERCGDGNHRHLNGETTHASVNRARRARKHRLDLKGEL